MYKTGGGGRATIVLNHSQSPFLNYFLFFNVYLFILKEKESTSRGGAERERERERERKRIPSRLCIVSAEPNVGLEPTNHDIVTWAETKSLTFNWLSHPGSPELLSILFGVTAKFYMQGYYCGLRMVIKGGVFLLLLLLPSRGGNLFTLPLNQNWICEIFEHIGMPFR